MDIRERSVRPLRHGHVVSGELVDAKTAVHKVSSPNDRSTFGVEDLRIRLLGGFNVSIGARVIDESEWYLRKAKNLVKLLALAPNHRMHRGQLVDLLWPDMDSAAAANNLHKALHIGRRVFEPSLPSKIPSSYLHMNGEFVSLDPPGSLWIDVQAFEAEVRRARRTLDPAAYEEALRLYGGELLPADRYEEWVIRRREQLRETQVTLLLELAKVREQRGEIDTGIEVLRRVVSSDPAHEEAQASLMRLLVQSGHRQLALRQYRQLCDALREELDVEPAPGIQRLYQQILDDRCAPGPQYTSASPSARSQPLHYPAEFAPLVGREKELQHLDEILVRTLAGRGGLALISGRGGIGKSRLAAEVRHRAEQRGAVTLWGAAYRCKNQRPYSFFAAALDGFSIRVAPETLEALLGDSACELAKVAPTVALATSSHPLHGAIGSFEQSRIFAAASHFFERLAEHAPVVAVFEDLQAADESGLQLLDHLASFAQDLPVLFIATCRAEEVAPDSAVARMRESLPHPLQLEPLRPGDAETMVTRLLGGPIDRSVLDLVQTLASGSPYYIEEAVRALRGRGWIHPVEGMWRVTNGNVNAWDRQHLRRRRDSSGDYQLAGRLRV